MDGHVINMLDNASLFVYNKLMDDQAENGFKYDPRQEDENLAGSQQEPEQQQAGDNNKSVTWTGSEFIANHKDSRWFASFFGILIVGVGAIFLVTRDYISAISVAVAGILFASLANRQPRQLTYQIDNKGINIGQKFYSFEQFKYFSLAQDGAIGYINLMPLKRFMPDVSIYFPPEEADNVIDILSDHLPHHDSAERQIDKLAKKFRF